jgi:energy-coupling factor transporter ATP-binding protein EcfA2
VVGPSGSGKSTLARAVAGLIPGAFPGEWSGSLTIGSGPAQRREGSPPADGGVGIVFQDPASQLVMDRAGDEVAFGLEARTWDLGAMHARVPEALAEVGLEGFERRHTNRLSGGEQQRVALAGVLAPRPEALVLDEPTANLDPGGAAALFERLAALRSSRATTIVLVEHRVDRAWPLADAVLALGSDGAPIDFGEPAAVLGRSADGMRAEGIWLPYERAHPGRPRAATSPEGGPVLDMREVRFAFPDAGPAVRDVDLSLGAGERVAIVGPNGSGKTTLLRLATGLLPPQAGLVALVGRDPRRLAAAELSRLVGYVAQDPELGFLADTVADEVAIGLDPVGVREATALADRLGLALERFGERSPYRLSGGEQRRLSLITALARRPSLLVLDEPTFGQDRRGHEALVDALDELVSSGTAILAATHDERFVEDVATRRIELADGWVVADDRIGRRE